MLDHTPRVGESHTPEDLLDALLVINRDELRATMTRTLDTDAGLRALATMHTGPLAEIEGGAGQATTPSTHPLDAPRAREVETLSVEENPYPAIELVDDFLVGLEEVRTSPGMPVDGAVACTDCADVMEELTLGLEERSVTRNEAKKLLAEAEGYLKVLEDLAAEPLRTGHGWIDASTARLIDALVAQLKALASVVARMFDDAHESISIEN
ncbi:hypothetical protein ABZ016_24735 [Streptomyces sp. NPDC006372]|uniref:hypothetical protein n=1 Tax=Streptomyces sp. NPDC006372 TaxID=3155599 RepID=UPI0033B9AAB8